MRHSYHIPLLLFILLWRFGHGIPLLDAFQSNRSHAIMRLAKSAEMRNYMQPHSDACRDFYKFACGNWVKINPAQTDAKTDMFHLLTKGFNRKIAQLLQAPKSTNDSDMERKVKYFYESCINGGTMPKHNYQQYLLGIMEEFGGMPALKGAQWQEEQFDWLAVVAKILRKYGKQIIIGASISNDLTNNAVSRLYIGQLDDLVTSRATEYYAHIKLLHQFELQQALGMSKTLAQHTAQEIVDFERKLAAGIIEPIEGLGMEDKTRLRMLDDMSESYKPVLNYTKFVSTWLGYEYRTPVYEYAEGYQVNLRKLILETPKQTVANYIMWQMLQDFRLDREADKEKHVKRCIGMTKRYFFKYLDHMVYKELMKSSHNSLLVIEKMWRSLKRAFEVILTATDTLWMRESTRDKALEKLSAMELQINAFALDEVEREFAAVVVNTNDYFENVKSVLQVRGQNYRQRLHESPKLPDDESLSYSPFYVAEFNKIIIPVAFLQPRYLWDDVYPAALKFATAGNIIAHEMAHGFDDTTRKYDAKGNLNNWWDRNSTELFAQRKECLRQQYGAISYAGKMLPKMQNQGENIADNVGIRVAFAAYEHWLTEHMGGVVQESLPLLPYTPKQLFFIGSAQLWCSDVNRQWRHFFASTDVHAPEEVRVHAMLSNFDEFAVAFNCSIGSKMNPHRKCVIY